MVVCGAMFKPEAIEKLKAARVRDSKLLGPCRRSTLAKLIQGRAAKCETVELSPAEIDELRLVKKINLNELTAMQFARVLDKLKPEIAYIDSADVNAARFGKTIRQYMRTKTKLVVEHGADVKYVVVGAASILAKVRRDQRIAELKKKHGEVGSGYSSDPITIRFLERWVQEHGRLPPFARKSWETAQRILARTKQRRLV
jgi:ribonuclease HII